MVRMSPHLLEEGIFTFKKNPGPGLCPVRGCRRGIGKKKTFCDAHHQYRWRVKSPKKSAYATLRDHAVGRGIVFTISAEYFAGLTDAHRFWDHEAVSHGDVLTIDRIDATKGYEPGNLTVLTMSLNVIKGNKERWLPEHIQHILDRKRAITRGEEPVEDDSENPF